MVNWLSETDLSDLLSSMRVRGRTGAGVANAIGMRMSEMLRAVRDQEGSQRRTRLFACACLRRVWDLLIIEGARRIVELAEGYADGEVSAAELQAATSHPSFDGVEDRFYGTEPRLSIRTGEAITAAQWLASPTFDTNDAAAIASNTSTDATLDYFRELWWEGRPAGIFPSATERVEQVRVLWDIFGNPFHPVAFDPTWRTSTTIALAAQMYKSRDFTAMPILAEALHDAGCKSEDILSHCRGGGPHVRGCWVVDKILGKE